MQTPVVNPFLTLTPTDMNDINTSTLPIEQTNPEVAAAAAAMVASMLARQEAKSARTRAVSAIKVTTTAGNTFDGNEASQDRMVRAIVALQASGAGLASWVLANNTEIAASVAELTEALILARQAQSDMWPLAC